VVGSAEHEEHAPVPAAASETHPARVVARAEPVVSATPSGVFFHVPGSTATASPQTSKAADPSKSEAPGAPVARVQAEAPTIDGVSEWEDHLEVQGPATAASEAAGEDPEQSKVLSTGAAETTAGRPEVRIAPSRDTQIEDSIEEVRFYLGQGMIDQADVVLKRLEAKSPDSAELAMLRVGVDSAKQQSPAAAPEAEIAIEESARAEAEEPIMEALAEQPHTASASSTMTQPWPQARPPAAQAPQLPHAETPPEQRPVLQELVSDLEESLGDDFLATEGPKPEAAKPEVHAPIPVEPEREGAHLYASGQEFRSNSLDDFVSDLEASFGTEPAAQPEQPAARQTAPLAHAAVAAATGPVAHASTVPVAPQLPRAPQAPGAPLSGAGVDLADIFGELKQELEGEPVSSDEDPETHYNLGVAFREMGLLDEAIGEFQKVTQAAEHGHAFSQLMQTYTWLAQCFLDKGIPQAAVRWYETALKVPGIDQETRTALHYELASSWESAGNRAAALNNFLEVYSSNIDYRDVGERIKALRS
jgi:tetratricopeptide (TPR) repeat protein